MSNANPLMSLLTVLLAGGRPNLNPQSEGEVHPLEDLLIESCDCEYHTKLREEKNAKTKVGDDELTPSGVTALVLAVPELGALHDESQRLKAEYAKLGDARTAREAVKLMTAEREVINARIKLLEACIEEHARRRQVN